jgi:hypothetical protein
MLAPRFGGNDPEAVVGLLQQHHQLRRLHELEDVRVGRTADAWKAAQRGVVLVAHLRRPGCRLRVVQAGERRAHRRRGGWTAPRRANPAALERGFSAPPPDARQIRLAVCRARHRPLRFPVRFLGEYRRRNEPDRQDGREQRACHGILLIRTVRLKPDTYVRRCAIARRPRPSGRR